MTVSHPSQNFAFVQREPKTQLKTRITRGDVPRHLNHRFSPGLRHSPQNGQQLQLPLSTTVHALEVMRLVWEEFVYPPFPVRLLHRTRVFIFGLSILFLFICTLHWCKHFTGLEVAPILPKFLLTALREIAVDAVVFRHVFVGTLFAPYQGFHILALNRFSFIFI